jgi:putative phage tail component, N-terminal domain protein
MVAVYSSKAKIKPSDNITLNGVDLMDAIPQYRQVKVSGRGLVGREVSTTTNPARSGVRVNSLQEKSIELEVEYILDCNSNEELRGAFEKLNKILKKDDVLTIRFADTQGYSYQGHFTNVGSISQTNYLAQGSFTLFVPYPYMQSDKQSSTTGLVQLTNASMVLPTKIEATVSANANEITIQTGYNTIRFKGNYLAGNRLKIEWLENEISIMYDGRSILTELVRLSDPESFFLRDGTRVTGKNMVITLVEWRDEKQ